MKKYLYEYINYVINNKNEIDLEDMLIKINFFQHERLIHLIITLFYVIMFLIFLILVSISYIFIIPAFILLIFVIFYIIHYFRLENGVQSLYFLYDEIKNKTKRDKKG
mgnify:FL=1